MEKNMVKKFRLSPVTERFVKEREKKGMQGGQSGQSPNTLSYELFGSCEDCLETNMEFRFSCSASFGCFPGLSCRRSGGQPSLHGDGPVAIPKERLSQLEIAMNCATDHATMKVYFDADDTELLDRRRSSRIRAPRPPSRTGSDPVRRSRWQAGATTTDQMSAQVAGLTVHAEAVHGLRRHIATQLGPVARQNEARTSNTVGAVSKMVEMVPKSWDAVAAAMGVEALKVGKSVENGSSPNAKDVATLCRKSPAKAHAKSAQVMRGHACPVQGYHWRAGWQRHCVQLCRAAESSVDTLHRNLVSWSYLRMAERAVIQSVFARTTNPEDRQEILQAAEDKVKHLLVTLTLKMTLLLQSVVVE